MTQARRTNRPSLACLVVLVVWAGFGEPGACLAQTPLEVRLKAEQAALDSLEAQLEADRKALQRATRERQSVAGELAALERSISQTRNELRSLAVRSTQLAARIESTRGELGDAEQRLSSRERGIADRLRKTHKLGRRGTLAVLFSAHSFAEGLRRIRYLSRAAHQDQVDLRALESGRRRVHEVLQLRQAQYAHQRSILEASRSKERQLDTASRARGQKLQLLAREQSSRRAAIEENERLRVESQNKLQQIIKEIELRKRAGGRLAELPAFDFEGKRGALPRPAKGRIVSAYGRYQDPELKTWTFNRGIGIAGAAGTDVRAIAPGEVMLVDWWRGYGQFVLLRHPGGYYSLYGHLESRMVETGEILAEGAVIGTVGSTGRLDGVPQLYFEIMKGEDAVDPTPWLAGE